MADGATKPVELIQQGDMVLAYDETTGKTDEAEVVRVYKPFMTSHYYVVNESLRLTEGHPMRSRGAWVGASDLQVGALLSRLDGANAPVSSVRRVDEPAIVYNFTVSLGTYFADGVLVHNKEDCLDYMQYCEECE